MYTHTLFDPADRAAILARLQALAPDAQRKWGTMTLGKMLCHCADQLRLALGAFETAPARGPLSWPPLRWLVIHVIPWPHGVATAPELLLTDPATLDGDRADLVGCIERFAERGPTGDFASHPLFGTLSATHWGRLAHRHLDHHLRQFSV